MTRKHSRGTGDTSSAPTPLKRSNVAPSSFPPPALPPHPLARKSVNERLRERILEGHASSSERASPPSSQHRTNFLGAYQKEYAKAVKLKFVKELEGMTLGEMAGSLKKITFHLATASTCYKV